MNWDFTLELFEISGPDISKNTCWTAASELPNFQPFPDLSAISIRSLKKFCCSAFLSSVKLWSLNLNLKFLEKGWNLGLSHDVIFPEFEVICIEQIVADGIVL